MPLYDFECADCGRITETFAGLEETVIVCVCGRPTRRIISISGQYLGNQDAPWLRSVLDVVDRESTKPHVREFIANPSRENYKKWMKGEGVRPMDHKEHGGPPIARKPQEPDKKPLVDYLWARHRARKALEVRS